MLGVPPTYTRHRARMRHISLFRTAVAALLLALAIVGFASGNDRGSDGVSSEGRGYASGVGSCRSTGMFVEAHQVPFGPYAVDILDSNVYTPDANNAKIRQSMTTDDEDVVVEHETRLVDEDGDVADMNISLKDTFGAGTRGESDQTTDMCNAMLKVPREERCEYVRKNCLDKLGSFIKYNEIYYCHMDTYPNLGLFLLLILVGYIFMVITVTSGEFFCPNLSNLVDWFQLPETIAGITLAALGNGAPDLFSTFTALNNDSPGLAIGELLGAAMILTLACSGTVAVIRPVVLKRSVIREVGCFIGALVILQYIAYKKEITFYNGLAMVTYYFGYISIMIYLAYRMRRDRQMLGSEHNVHGGFGNDENVSGEKQPPLIVLDHQTDSYPQHIHFDDNGNSSGLPTIPTNEHHGEPSFTLDTALLANDNVPLVFDDSDFLHGSHQVNIVIDTGDTNDGAIEQIGDTSEMLTPTPDTQHRPSLGSDRSSLGSSLSPLRMSRQSKSATGTPEHVAFKDELGESGHTRSDSVRSTSTLSLSGQNGASGPSLNMLKGKQGNRSRSSSVGRRSASVDLRLEFGRHSEFRESKVLPDGSMISDDLNRAQEEGRASHPFLLDGQNLISEPMSGSIPQLNVGGKGNMFEIEPDSEDEESHGHNRSNSSINHFDDIDHSQHSQHSQHSRHGETEEEEEYMDEDFLINPRIVIPKQTLLRTVSMASNGLTASRAGSPFKFGQISEHGTGQDDYFSLPLSRQGSVSSHITSPSRTIVLHPPIIMDRGNLNAQSSSSNAAQSTTSPLQHSFNANELDELSASQHTSGNANEAQSETNLNVVQRDHIDGFVEGVRDGDIALWDEMEAHGHTQRYSHPLVARYLPVIANWDYMDLKTRIRGIVLTPVLLILLLTIPVVHVDDLSSNHKHLDKVQSAIQMLLIPPLAFVFVANEKYLNKWVSIDHTIPFVPDIYVPLYGIFIGIGVILSLIVIVFTARVDVIEKVFGIKPPSARSSIALTRSAVPNNESTARYAPLADAAPEANVVSRQTAPANEPVPTSPGRNYLAVDEVASDGHSSVGNSVVYYHEETSEKKYLICSLESMSRFFAVAGFLSGMVWIYAIANEIVGIFKTIVSITGVSETIMGLTLFAFGSSVGDFVTNTSIAEMGYPLMAFSACFGSPMLNLVLGVGFTSTYVMVTTKKTKYALGDDMDAIFFSTTALIIIMVTFLSVLIFVTKFKISRTLGYYMIAMWVLLITSVLVLNFTF